MLSSSLHLAAASTAAPLQSTRLLRALTPVAVAHSDSFGSFRVGARATASSRHRGSNSAATLPGSVVRTYVPDPHLTSGTTNSGATGTLAPAFTEESLRVNRAPVPAPDFPLDKLPYYEPNDLNGTPRVRFGSMEPMLSLPAPLAPHFFFPGVDLHTSGAGGGPGAGHAFRGDDAEADGDAADGGYGAGRTGGHRSSWSPGARYGADAPASGYGGGSSGGGGAASAGAAEEAASAVCRLCGGNIDGSRGTRGHLHVVERSNHTSHHLREVALDTLTLLLVRGYPVDDIMTVWADILYSHPAYPRIHALSNPRWSIEKRAERLGDVLHSLRHAGIIEVSLAASDPVESPSGMAGIARTRSVAFQRLEYFGDTCWGANSASRIMLLFPDQQWLYSERAAIFAVMRDACEMNVNLDFVFDTLRLSQLMPRASTARLGAAKVKADMVEALLGELHLHLHRMTPMLQDDVEYVEPNGAREAQLVGIIQHCITEIYDLIVLNLARALVTTSIPLAKELAAKRVWTQTRPLLLPFKRPAVRNFDGLRARMGSLSSVVGSHANASAAASVLRGRTARPGFLTTASAANAAAETLEDFFDVTPGSVQQSADSAAADPATSTTAATSPSRERESLAVTAAIALGNTRVLPALPGLFSRPRALPATGPHPLRRLPLREIPQHTYCEHTGGDVFAVARRSYDRLGLLREAEALPRCVVSRAPPDWAPLISVLVPQLVRLTDTAVDRSPDDPADAVATGPAGEAQAEAVRRLFASMEERGLYWRDPFYNLTPAPTAGAGAADGAAEADMAAAVFAPSPAWALANAGLPPLAAAAAKESGADGDGGAGGGGGTGRPGGIFAASRYVAPGTRAPPAGVVTDRNLSRGTFAFLAVGVHVPVERAERLTSGVEKTTTDGDGESGATTGQQTRSNATDAPVAAPDAASPAAGSREYSEERVKAAFDYWRRRRRQVNPTAAPAKPTTREAAAVSRVFAVGAA